MKRFNWVRLIAVVLVISMLAAPVSAVKARPGADNRTNSLVGSMVGTIRDIIRDIIDDWFERPTPGKPISPKPPKPVEPTTPTSPVEPSEPEETQPVVTDPTEPEVTEPTEPENPTEPGDAPETELELVEGYNTTENGQLLRGQTYTLSQLIAEQTKPSVSHVGLRKPVQIKPRNPISGLSINAVSTTAADDTATYTAIASITVAEVWAAAGGTAANTWYSTPYYYNTGSAYFPVEIYNYGSYYLVSYLNSNGSRPSNPSGLGYRAADDVLTCLYEKTGESSGSAKIEGITGTASSVDTTEAAFNKSVGNAFDGDYGTFWATVPNSTLADCYLIANLGGKYTIDKVQYTKRISSGSYNCTGNLLNYVIEVSTDGTTWSQVATGSTIDGTTVITFNEVEATHVRLTATESYHWQDGTNGKPDNRNTVMTCAELEIFGYKATEPEPDPDPIEPTDPDPDPIEPVDPTVGESIPYSNLTWARVKNANFTYYLDDKCTNPVTVTAKDDGSGYELVDASGNVVATLNGSDLSQKIGVMLHVPSYIVFFPVTMYDYDDATINNATHAKDVAANPALTKWQGIYFNGGSPWAVEYSTGRTSWIDGGQYYIQSARAAKNIEASYLSGSVTGGITGVTEDNATLWTLHIVDNNTFRLSTEIDGTTYYMAIGSTGADGESLTTTPTDLTITTCSDTTDYVDGDGNLLQICGVKYLNQHGGVAVTTYGGENSANDSGNAMWFYLVDGDTKTKVTSGGSINAGFADWNFWAKNSNNNANGDLFYTGLVQPELVKDQIQFTVPDGGIFNADTDVKDIYEFVGVPFVLNTETGVYSFDSDYNGAYFKGAPQSGTASEPHNLQFALEAPQPMPNGLSVGDGSTNAFLPFNNQSSYNTSDVNYHFGMRADLPFSMTPNGCVNSINDNSDAITFTFSGDDDVWIFIDGKLVADMGGIHNRLDITLNFADNTIVYSEENSQDADNTTTSYNDPAFKTTQKLFNEGSENGVLGMTRTEFASDETHTMQFFYLERGEGTSNCRIEFNLPMRDTVLVTKDITKSWSEEQDEADGDQGDGTASLTAKEQAAVDKLNFYFKLYKKEKGGEFTVVANTNYFLQDREGNVLGIQATGPDGMFALKNGQSAKFMTDIHREGITYYVEELNLDLSTFLTPDYNYRGLATNGFDYTGIALDTDSAEDNATKEVNGHVSDASQIAEHELPMNATELKSYDITAYGSIESIDSLEFICTNYLNAELPNPTARAYEDIIVIDYGLPVHIDPLHNDLFRGDDIEIVAWGDESLVLNEVLDSYGNAVDDQTTWTGTQVFHSGNVTFNDVTYAETTDNDTITYVRDTFDYQLTKQLTEVEVIHYIIKVTSTLTDDVTDVSRTASRYALGKVYIVPATIMYYEENFSDMILFEGAAWNDKSTVSSDANVSAYQEPGVAGTTTDSTYGSDVAYLRDNGDSNGTYRYADTTNKAARFTYTFTGTGTTIFARTSASTGFIQVKLYEGAKAEGSYDTFYVDTYWKDDNGTDLDVSGTLYNIPVFTKEDLPYGTYTIVCTIAKAGTPTDGNPNGAGNEFYLDGIRVMQPLNEDADLELTNKALNAYAADGETNLDTVTLRDKLINDVNNNEAESFAVLTDINGAIDPADFIAIGPNEEVYMAPGQKVTFSLKSWQPEGLKLYMGMKAPFGEAKVNVGHESVKLYNAPDCYYDVTNHYESLVPVTEADGSTSYVVTYSFEATESIVSLTNIKVVGNYEFIIVPKPTN